MTEKFLETPDELAEALNCGKIVFSYNGDTFRKSKLPSGGFIMDVGDIYYVIDKIEFEKDVYYTVEKD
jgi:hypothetical protein